MQVSRRFPNRPTSVRNARHFVSGSLVDANVDLFAAEVLTSELATNAVQHAHSPFEVRVRCQDHRVRVEVVNDEPETLAAIREPDDEGGRGLRIVDALARAWGTYVDRSHEVVWFELDEASPAEHLRPARSDRPLPR